MKRASGVLLAMIGALVLSAAACDPTSESANTTGPIYVPPTTATTTVPPTTVPATTTTVPVDLVASCVDYGKFQAFVGDDFWARLWENAGRTDGGMYRACEFLASTAEPGWLNEIDQQWQAIRALDELAPTTTRLP